MLCTLLSLALTICLHTYLSQQIPIVCFLDREKVCERNLLHRYCLDHPLQDQIEKHAIPVHLPEGDTKTHQNEVQRLTPFWTGPSSLKLAGVWTSASRTMTLTKPRWKGRHGVSLYEVTRGESFRPRLKKMVDALQKVLSLM
jgi:hypothetical protein